MAIRIEHPTITVTGLQREAKSGAATGRDVMKQFKKTLEQHSGILLANHVSVERKGGIEGVQVQGVAFYEAAHPDTPVSMENLLFAKINEKLQRKIGGDIHKAWVEGEQAFFLVVSEDGQERTLSLQDLLKEAGISREAFQRMLIVVKQEIETLQTLAEQGAAATGVPSGGKEAAKTSQEENVASAEEENGIDPQDQSANQTDELFSLAMAADSPELWAFLFQYLEMRAKLFQLIIDMLKPSEEDEKRWEAQLDEKRRLAKAEEKKRLESMRERHLEEQRRLAALLDARHRQTLLTDRAHANQQYLTHMGTAAVIAQRIGSIDERPGDIARTEYEIKQMRVQKLQHDAANDGLKKRYEVLTWL